MSVLFKTVRGEAYSSCDILFGASPVEVSDETLGEVINRQGVENTVEQWLMDDPRLQIVVPDITPAEPPGDGDEGDDSSGSLDVERGGRKGRKKGKGRPAN